MRLTRRHLTTSAHSPHSQRRSWPVDALPLAALTLVTALLAWDLAGRGTRIGLDSAVFFYPIFHLLGERLASGDLLPGWNPHQFAGIPLAGDPQSGWGYLPAMVLFSLLPLSAAAPAFAIGHLALAGFGLYAFARTIRLRPVGALTAAVAFECSGFFRDRAVCCFAHVMVAAWLPCLLLAAERAVTARAWTARIGWWALASLSVSQILAGWLGQGASYALLLLGAYLFYRTVLAPASLPARAHVRLGQLLGHGTVILATGFGLGAAALLPRVEYNARSTLEGGYAGSEAVVGGLRGVDDAVARLLGPSGWYVGGGVAALALFAPLLARWRWQTVFWWVVGVAALVLSTNAVTPFHRLLFTLLPGFERLHRHYPDRALLVLYLAVALLAGAAVGAVTERPRWAGGVVIGLALLSGLALLRLSAAVPPREAVVPWVAVALVLALWSWLRVPWRGSLLPLALLLIVGGDLLWAGRTVVARFPRVDLAAYYAPGPAGSYLMSRTAEAPSRFFGFAPAVALGGPWPAAAYRYNFADPSIAALVVNDRATALGLEDVQGYNPLQLQRFADLLLAANGVGQEYREANVLPNGVNSSLLALLGVRYAVISAAPPNAAQLDNLFQRWTPVFADAQVRIVENPRALARAWLVHQARRVRPGDALTALASGTVDPRQVALIETDVPDLALPAVGATEQAEIVDRTGDQLRLHVQAAAPALLLIGDAAYPGWQATVDGAAVPVLTADHLLRAVAVPAGDHTVELRFRSQSLWVGTLVSLGTIGLIVVAFVAVWTRRVTVQEPPGVAVAGPAW